MKKLVLLSLFLILMMGFVTSAWAVLLNESFTGTTFPPAEWSSSGTAWGRYTSYYNTTPACTKSGYSSGNWWLITPRLQPAAGANTLTFWYRDYSANAGWDYSNEYTYVKVSTGTTGQADFTTTVWTGNYTQFTTTWQQATIDLSAYNGQNIYLAFHSVHTGGNYRMIDDVTGVNLAPASMPPSSTTLVSPTNAATNVLPTATLNWNSATGSPTGYKLYFGTDGAGTATPTNIVNNSDLGNVLTYDPVGNLAYSTTYYWQIVPYNGNGNATGCPIWSFTTGADPTVSNLLTTPYVQNFDSVTAPALPYGWSMVDGDAVASINWKTGTSYYQSSPNSMYIGYTPSGSPRMNDWFFTPPLQLYTGNNYKVQFYYKGGSSSYLESLSLNYGSAPSIAGMTTELWSSTDFYVANYTLVSANISVPTSGVYYVGWKCFSTDDELFVSVDDVTISYVPPTPSFAVAPASKDFGAQYVDNAVTQVFTISNGGGGDLHVPAAGITLTDNASGYYTFNPAPTDLTIPPSGTGTVTVQFLPTVAGGPYTANLSIAHDGTNVASPQVVALTGTATGPALGITPASKAFGDVMVNLQTASQVFTLTNTGGGTLQILNVAQTAGDTYFSFSGLPSFPVNLAHNATTTFTLNYAPTALGAHTATVTVTDGRATTDIAITGTGIAPAYGTSASTSTVDDDIGQYTVGSFTNPTGTVAVLSNPDAIHTYTDWTALGPIDMQLGATLPVSILEIQDDASWYNCYAKVFIDYDQNYIFNTATEVAFEGAITQAANPLTGTLTVPVTATLGNTRMRVVLMESGSTSTVLPTGTYGYGETEDYTVNILPASTDPVEAVTLVSPANGATGIDPAAVTLTWSNSVTGGIPTSYEIYVGSAEIDPGNEYYGEYTYHVEAPTTTFDLSAELGATLAYSTRWYWTIQANRGDSEYAITLPSFSFQIMDDPTITSFPYTEDFTSWPPTGWTLSGTFNWDQYDTGTDLLAYADFWDYTSGNYAIMTTPPINSASQLQLTFTWSHLYHSSYPNDKLEIDYSLNGTDWVNVWSKTTTALNSNDGAGNTTPGTGLTESVVLPLALVGQNFTLRFNAISGYGPNLYVDDVILAAPATNDVAVTSIGFNGAIHAAAFAPAATVINNGLNTNSFNVTLTIGAWSSTMPVTDLAMGATQVVTFDNFTPVAGTLYSATVTTALATDEVPANDTMSKNFYGLNLDVDAFAYGANATPEGAYSFNLQTPGTLNYLGGGAAPTNFLSAGAWINGTWYATEYDDGTLVSDFLYTIDPTTGVLTSLGQIGMSLTGMAYDATNNVVYATDGTSFYSFDVSTGSSTLIGTLGSTGLMIGIAFDHANGICYGVDLGTSNLYTIDTTTGAATAVGPLGISLNYAQDMSFDQANGNIYLAGYTSAGALYYIDEATGTAYLVGNFQNNTEMDCFVIPYAAATLETPAVTISTDVTGLPKLEWAAIAGATSYYVYWDVTADGTFGSAVGPIADTMYLPDGVDTPRFYKVTASSDPAPAAVRNVIHRPARTFRTAVTATHDLRTGKLLWTTNEKK